MGRKRKKSSRRREEDPSGKQDVAKLTEKEGQEGATLIAPPPKKQRKTAISTPLEPQAAQSRSHDGSEGAQPVDESSHNNRHKKKKKKKKADSMDKMAEEGAVKKSPEEPSGPQPSFPYPTDGDDHCESPKEAYEHILPLLQYLQKKTSPFLIYDPYYCDGAVKENLKELGFPDVYNEKEDCYQVWSEKSFPNFSAFVTNPPYSGDHIGKLTDFIASKSFGTRPWFLLMPNWVHKKDYFLNATKNIHPFYLVPRKRYVYLPPKGFRDAKKSDVHKKSSPFVSMWYVWGGTKYQNDALMRCYLKASGRDGSCALARSKSALRDLRRKKR